jgi:hypothetical protein
MSADAELLATMIRASDGRIDLNLDGDQLDLIAYDIADTMDKGEYGLGDVTQDDIRAVLPAFLIACLANAEANEVLCDRCGGRWTKPGERGRSLCEGCVERRNES